MVTGMTRRFLASAAGAGRTASVSSPSTATIATIRWRRLRPRFALVLFNSVIVLDLPLSAVEAVRRLTLKGREGLRKPSRGRPLRPASEAQPASAFVPRGALFNDVDATPANHRAAARCVFADSISQIFCAISSP